MNIYEKLSAVTMELQTVAKGLFVETGKDKSGRPKGYNAVSERDILDAVKPLESKHKVYSFPVSREILESAMLENETQYGKKTTFFSRIKTVYRFVNAEQPEEYVETTVFSEGMDSQDKGSGKAMTYGDKYALMKMYKISTGDDPDASASEEASYKRRQTDADPLGKGEAQRTGCESCGKPLTPAQRALARQKYGRLLCPSCQAGLSGKGGA